MMRQPIKALSLFALIAALAACSGNGPEEQGASQAEPTAQTEVAADRAETAPAPAEEPAAVAVQEAPVAVVDANAVPAAFAQCRSCHSTEPGKNMIGPSLAGIFGTKAGDVAGYNFSTAMKESGLTWDQATLDRFLKAPQQVIPGTRMTYPGVKDDAKRAAVVAYIKALK